MKKPMWILSDPCCLILLAIGVIALLVKLVQWVSTWFK